MAEFIFFPPACITQTGRDSFRINDIYGGIFNINEAVASVYLAQEPKYEAEQANILGISNVEYNSIINALKQHKIIYPSSTFKEKPFDSRRVLEQIANSIFEKERTLSIGDVTLEITQECPYHCEGCFREITRDESLSITKIKGLIDELKGMGLTKLSISGGEITFKQEYTERAKEVIAYAKSRKIETIRLLTTGFNPKRLEELIESGANGVQISIDGDENAHNAYKKHGSAYNKAIEAIKLCQGKKGIRLTTNTVVSKQNIDVIRKVMATLEAYDIDTMRITKIITANQGLRLNPKEAKQLHNIICAAQKIYGNKILNAYGNCTNHLNCVAGIVYAHIGATGNVFPCDYVPHMSAGNITEQSFQEIWTNSDVIKLFKTPKKIAAGCIKCKERVFCIGNCIVEAKNLKIDEGCYYG